MLLVSLLANDDDDVADDDVADDGSNVDGGVAQPEL